MREKRILIILALLSQSECFKSIERVKADLMEFDLRIGGTDQDIKTYLFVIHLDLVKRVLLRPTHPSVWDLSQATRRLNFEPPECYVDIPAHLARWKLQIIQLEKEDPELYGVWERMRCEPT